MKNMKKIIVVAMAVAMLALAVTAGTLAWLHDNVVINGSVWTYGDVEIDLAATVYDELALLPGRTYVMKPTVTVKDTTNLTDDKGSTNEDTYVRLFVTISDATDLISVLKATEQKDDVNGKKILDIEKCINTLDTSKWILYASALESNTIVYEFRYVGHTTAGTDGVQRVGVIPKDFAKDADQDLAATFNTFTLPNYLNDEDVKKLAELTVTFEAQAMQAVEADTYDKDVNGDLTVTTTYFEDADAAWDEFDSQISGAINNPNETPSNAGAHATIKATATP